MNDCKHQTHNICYCDFCSCDPDCCDCMDCWAFDYCPDCGEKL